MDDNKSDLQSEEVLKTLILLVINGYRQISKKLNIAPTSKTSDEKIIEIYQKVVSSFKDASKIRNEHIPAVYLNYIVLKFFQIYEKMPKDFFDEHLVYEIDKYIKSGLRSDYKVELKLFQTTIFEKMEYILFIIISLIIQIKSSVQNDTCLNLLFLA